MNTIIEKIRAEVLRLIRESDCSQWGLGKMSACNRILNFLDTLEKEEKPMNSNEGLEEELVKYIGYPEENLDGKWKKKEVEEIARHFYELGRQSKPKVSEDVETEALRSACVLLSEHFEYEDDDAIRTTALRCWKGGVIHGASWQKERDEKELSEKIASAYQLGRKDEKEQMMKEANKALESCDKNTASYKDAFFAGVDWKEREMMKEAVEGEVVTTNKYTSVRYLSRYGTFRYFYGIGGGFQKGDKGHIIFVKED